MIGPVGSAEEHARANGDEFFGDPSKDEQDARFYLLLWQTEHALDLELAIATYPRDEGDR